MEGLFGVTLEGQPALHLVMDPDHLVAVPSAPASTRGAHWEASVGWWEGGGHCASILHRVIFIFFSSVGLMNGQEETVWENVASSQLLPLCLCYCIHVAIQ